MVYLIFTMVQKWITMICIRTTNYGIGPKYQGSTMVFFGSLSNVFPFVVQKAQFYFVDGMAILWSIIYHGNDIIFFNGYSTLMYLSKYNIQHLYPQKNNIENTMVEQMYFLSVVFPFKKGCGNIMVLNSCTMVFIWYCQSTSKYTIVLLWYISKI